MYVPRNDGSQERNRHNGGLTGNRRSTWLVISPPSNSCSSPVKMHSHLPTDLYNTWQSLWIEYCDPISPDLDLSLRSRCRHFEAIQLSVDDDIIQRSDGCFELDPCILACSRSLVFSIEDLLGAASIISFQGAVKSSEPLFIALQLADSTQDVLLTWHLLASHVSTLRTLFEVLAERAGTDHFTSADTNVTTHKLRDEMLGMNRGVDEEEAVGDTEGATNLGDLHKGREPNPFHSRSQPLSTIKDSFSEILNHHVCRRPVSSSAMFKWSPSERGYPAHGNAPLVHQRWDGYPPVFGVRESDEVGFGDVIPERFLRMEEKGLPREGIGTSRTNMHTVIWRVDHTVLIINSTFLPAVLERLFVFCSLSWLFEFDIATPRSTLSPCLQTTKYALPLEQSSFGLNLQIYALGASVQLWLIAYPFDRLRDASRSQNQFAISLIEFGKLEWFSGSRGLRTELKCEMESDSRIQHVKRTSYSHLLLITNTATAAPKTLPSLALSHQLTELHINQQHETFCTRTRRDGWRLRGTRVERRTWRKESIERVKVLRIRNLPCTSPSRSVLIANTVVLPTHRPRQTPRRVPTPFRNQTTQECHLEARLWSIVSSPRSPALVRGDLVTPSLPSISSSLPLVAPLSSHSPSLALATLPYPHLVTLPSVVSLQPSLFAHATSLIIDSLELGSRSFSHNLSSSHFELRNTYTGEHEVMTFAITFRDVSICTGNEGEALRDIVIRAGVPSEYISFSPRITATVSPFTLELSLGRCLPACSSS
jgi:hypothetical protein